MSKLILIVKATEALPIRISIKTRGNSFTSAMPLIEKS